MIKSKFLKNLDKIIKLSILEDATNNDITSKFIFAKNNLVEAKIISKENAILCGIPVIKKIISKSDGSLKLKILKKDGQKLKKNTIVLILHGRIKSILKIERILLNYLGILSAVSTKTNRIISKCSFLK